MKTLMSRQLYNIAALFHLWLAQNFLVWTTPNLKPAQPINQGGGNYHRKSVGHRRKK